MPGAESEPGFDAEGNDAMRHPALVMRAIHEETPRAHRRKAFLREPDPVLIGQQRNMHGRPASRESNAPSGIPA